MGFEESIVSRGSSSRFRCLTRRKQGESNMTGPNEGGQQLARDLGLFQILGIGIGSTIGAGVYVLVGTVAREHLGPALPISFFVAGVAAAFSAFCYAELARRFPSAGSAYHYAYICVGEGVAWLIGWALILEYTIGGSAVARGISPNLALIFGGEDKLPAFLARVQISGIGMVVDPCAACLVITVTVLLSSGIKESSTVQSIVTCVNVCVLLFVCFAGLYLSIQSGWVGYNLEKGYLPFGVTGMITGSANVFFAYIGFDSIASAAEEVRNPQRDLPWGIGLSLGSCCVLYMGVSAIIVGLVPYYDIDPATPISSAFASYGMKWAGFVVSIGAITALCASLMGSLLPQPRILMAMARDGLLHPWLSDVNSSTQVPINSTLLTGFLSVTLAFFVDVDILAGMVSVGTLFAFTIVALCVLILRYVPPNGVAVQARQTGQEGSEESRMDNVSDSSNEENMRRALLVNIGSNAERDQERRGKAIKTIAFICLVDVLLTLLLSVQFLSLYLKLGIGCLGAVLLSVSVWYLWMIGEDNRSRDLELSGGFKCPGVPLLPVTCIVINTFLLMNISLQTWGFVCVWLFVGVVIYIFYGRSHSKLLDTTVYAPSKRDLQE